MSKRIGFVVALVVATLVVVIVAATRGSNEHEPASAAGPSTTRPVSRATVREPTSTGPGTTVGSTLPTATLPPPFTSAQLERALLQDGDLPLRSRRDIVPPNAWGGVCGSSPPAFAAPNSAAAVDFNGSDGLHVREDLADYDNPAGYLDAVRAKIACTTYMPDGRAAGTRVTVVPIPPAVIEGGIDTSSGAVAFGVKTVDSEGHASYHVWLRHGPVVISIQDDALTATEVSAVQLTQLAFQRVQGTLA